MRIVERIQDFREIAASNGWQDKALKIGITPAVEPQDSHFDFDSWLELRARSLTALSACGALKALKDLSAAFWPHGSVEELSIVDAHRIVGLGLIIKSGIEGTVDFYKGSMFIVGFDAKNEKLIIFSGEPPFSLRLNRQIDGWTSKQRKKIEKGIVSAFFSPGSFQWSNGQAGESLYYQHGLI